MKNVMIGCVLSMFSLSAQAAVYNCNLSGWKSDVSHETVTYQINSAEQENKFVDLGEGASVGCVVFRSQPQLLTCGVGRDENFSEFVTADDGSSVISLRSRAYGEELNLTCFRKP
jgi:hypothetical protein